MSNEIQWTATPPTEPGLYPYTNKAANPVVMLIADRSTGRCGQVLYLDGCVADWMHITHYQGHWGPRIDFAPYVPPKPPEIEAWVCERERMYLALPSKKDNDFVLLCNDSKSYWGLDSRANWEARGYTNWRPLKVTTELEKP